MAIGYLLLIEAANRLTGLGIGEMFIPLLIAGIGQGSVAAPLIQTVLSGVKGPHAGAASGVLNTFTQVAQAVGIAVIGTLYQSLLDRLGAASPADPSIRTMQWALVAILLLAALTLLLLALLGRKRKEPVAEIAA
jgi:hypothetical protein